MTQSQMMNGQDRGVIGAVNRPMLSRVADAMYWMSRYVERAEHISRILVETSSLLTDIGDLAPALRREYWRDVLRVLGLDAGEVADQMLLGTDVGRPATCPHGFPIPEASVDRIAQMPSLEELGVGEGGVVALSGSTDGEIVAFLDSLGIRPGVPVEVLEKHPFDGPIVVRVEHERKHRTVGERVARQIFVKSLHDAPGRPETEAVDGLNIHSHANLHGANTSSGAPPNTQLTTQHTQHTQQSIKETSA